MDGLDAVQMPEATPGAEPAEMTGLRVPLAALQTVDDGDQPVQPAIGDRVSVQMDAIVSGAEGDYAMLTPSAFNGVPAEGTAGHEQGETPEQEAGEDAGLAALKQQAAGIGTL